MQRKSDRQEGSTLVVTIIVVASLLVLLGAAVDYTTGISRNTQRSRKTALAMEIADGHLETLFTNWRNIYRTTWVTYGMNTGGTDLSVCGTNFFPTALSVPNPAATPIPNMVPSATPPVIPTPPPSMFPTEAAYQVTQYRIQAVDPMINLDGNENALVESGSKGGGSFIQMADDAQPPGSYGPSLGPFGYYYPYSFYYLAAADVTVPALTGNVTAKVRRVFEKKFDLPWTYALFFVDDLEIEPSSSFTVNGPIHTNGSLYITTSNFNVAAPTYTGTNACPTSGRVEYGSDYVNGYSPKDSRYPGSGFTAPAFAKSDPALSLSDCPPAQVAAYLPFGWNLSLSSANGSGNDDGYHEIVEGPIGYPVPSSTSSDPLTNVRYYNQAGIKVIIDYNSYVTVYRSDITYPLDPTKSVLCTASSTGVDLRIWKLIAGPSGAVGTYSASTGKSVATNLALQDARELDTTTPFAPVKVRISEVNINKITAAVNSNSTSTNVGGYTNIDGIKDTSATPWRFNGVIYIADTTPPYEYSTGKRVVVPAPAVTVPDPNSSAATPSPSPFDSTGAVKAKLGGSSSVTTTERAIRLTNGWALPTTGVTDPITGALRGGLTIVSLNPVYILGNFNTSSTNTATNPPTPSATPPSNVTATSLTTASGYTQQPAAIVCDAVNILSGNWDDTKSTQTISGGGYSVTSARAATSTTVNAALVSGIVPTSSAGYSGGAEGFIRLQEDWRTQNFVYNGSISQFFTSLQGNTAGAPSGQYYKAPANTRFSYDYATFADGYPPGNLQIAAYLQQQRWYQVY